MNRTFSIPVVMSRQFPFIPCPLRSSCLQTLSGTLNENFVYINLKKRQDFPAEIVFETPAFATYKGGKIDFVA